MYVILVYDIAENRVSKVLKLCRQYLHRIQNSVFEGEISEKNFNELVRRLKGIIDDDKDTVVIFKFRTNKLFNRITLGKENKEPSFFVDDEWFE